MNHLFHCTVNIFASCLKCSLNITEKVKRLEERRERRKRPNGEERDEEETVSSFLRRDDAAKKKSIVWMGKENGLKKEKDLRIQEDSKILDLKI